MYAVTTHHMHEKTFYARNLKAQTPLLVFTSGSIEGDVKKLWQLLLAEPPAA